ncbi:MAG: hypothetical protein HBSIN02_20310 [Bacteroidia bacterium]|nr:MAG: hypothetical protein HBSIN02_20310 [Bacteroidia bacterium]
MDGPGRRICIHSVPVNRALDRSDARYSSGMGVAPSLPPIKLKPEIPVGALRCAFKIPSIPTRLQGSSIKLDDE